MAFLTFWLWRHLGFGICGLQFPAEDGRTTIALTGCAANDEWGLFWIPKLVFEMRICRCGGVGDIEGLEEAGDMLVLKALEKLETRWDVTKEDGAKEGEMETQLIDKEGERRKSNTYIWGERQSHSPHMESVPCADTWQAGNSSDARQAGNENDNCSNNCICLSSPLGELNPRVEMVGGEKWRRKVEGHRQKMEEQRTDALSRVPVRVLAYGQTVAPAARVMSKGHPFV
jgi:hypothetical protein